MGHRLIKQPNGNYSVFSTITDDIILVDYPRHELVEHYLAQAVEDARVRTEEWINGETPGRRLWTIEEVCEDIERIHGPDRAAEAKEALEVGGGDDY